ncbi:transposable element Tcb1 transposase [Trichonephila clavipes]|uniref:Transposable element Tcb1 transposase n=1 Tax=Trichonephila clavipes TaxID=2585209 RepID=A0A8X6VMQ5_TRICX|nr:transposable element Tcb1 transposase [Trichonephila clavipes]
MNGDEYSLQMRADSVLVAILIVYSSGESGEAAIIPRTSLKGTGMEVVVFSFGEASCLVVVQTFTSSTQRRYGSAVLFMDDNAPCHRTVAAEQFLEIRRLAARTLPPITIRELRLALEDEWAAMPQQLIDTLILSMGRRCETCLAVREIISPTKDRMFLAGHPSQGCFGLQSHCAPCYFFNQASFIPLISLLWNNRIVMAQRKHLEDFLRGRIIGGLECGHTQLEVSEELGIAQSVISRLWQQFQDDGNRFKCVPLTSNRCHLRLTWSREHALWTPQQWSWVMFSDESRFSLQSDSRRTLIWRAPGTRYHQENTIERHHYRGAGWLVWGGIISGSRTDLHVHSVTMTGHISLSGCHSGTTYECLQSEDITRTDWPAYLPDMNPIEYVWDMIGRGIAAHQPPPTCLPELRRALLD